METVETGWNCLVDVRKVRLKDVVAEKLRDKPVYVEGLYGDGKASEKVVAAISAFLEG